MEQAYDRFLTIVASIPDTLVHTAGYIAAIVLSGALTWWLFNGIMRRLERKHRKRPFFQKNQTLFAFLRRGGHHAILILMGAGFLNVFRAAAVDRVFFAVLIFILASMINHVIHLLIPYVEQVIVSRTKTHVDDVMMDLCRKFSGVIIYTTGGILALDILGLNIMPFVAGAGVAGVAIGFAAKDTLSNLIAGILLIIDRPFEVGDRIEVWSAPNNSATWGDVIDIGLRATKIRTTDNIVIIIPNNVIMTRDIINYTTIAQEIRVRIPIGIAYDADVNKAKALIEGVSLEMDWVMKERPPKVVVKSFGDSAVNLEARIWIRDPRRRIDTISHMTDRIKAVFEQQGIEIPYPKRDIYLKKGPDGI